MTDKYWRTGDDKKYFYNTTSMNYIYICWLHDDELYVYNYDIYMNYIYILVIYIFLLIYLQGF